MPDVGNIVASRDFELDGMTTVHVKIYEPVADDSDFYCRCEVKGLSECKQTKVYGVDSIQALNLALQHAGIFLYTSPEYIGKRLTWLGQYDLGLPTRHLQDTKMASGLQAQ